MEHINMYILYTLYTVLLCGKNVKTLTEKIFRQINYLVIYLENALLSRNF